MSNNSLFNNLPFHIKYKIFTNLLSYEDIERFKYLSKECYVLYYYLMTYESNLFLVLEDKYNYDHFGWNGEQDYPLPYCPDGYVLHINIYPLATKTNKKHNDSILHKIETVKNNCRYFLNKIKIRMFVMTKEISELSRVSHLYHSGDIYGLLINGFPDDLTHLDLSVHENECLRKIVFPKSLTHLTLRSFNQEIKEKIFPVGLKHLDLGGDFNKTIGKEVLPDSLRYLKLGSSFNQKIEEDVLPDGLTHLILDNTFEQEIEENVLPKSLQYLRISEIVKLHESVTIKCVEILEKKSIFDF